MKGYMWDYILFVIWIHIKQLTLFCPPSAHFYYLTPVAFPSVHSNSTVYIKYTCVYIYYPVPLTVLTLHPEVAHFKPFFSHFSHFCSPLPSIRLPLSVDPSPLGDVDSWMALCLTRVLVGHTHKCTGTHTSSSYCQ